MIHMTDNNNENEQNTSDYDREAARICGLETNRLKGHREALALEKALKDSMGQREDVSVRTDRMTGTIRVNFSIRGAEALTGILDDWNDNFRTVCPVPEPVNDPEEPEFTVQETRRFVEDVQELKVQLARANSQLEHAERFLDAIDDVCQDTVMQSTGIVRSVRECVSAYQMSKDINGD